MPLLPSIKFNKVHGAKSNNIKMHTPGRSALVLLGGIVVSFFVSFVVVVEASSEETVDVSTTLDTIDGSCHIPEKQTTGKPKSIQDLTGIRRFTQSEFVQNYTELLPCLNQVPPSVGPFMADYRKKARDDPPYSSLPCAPSVCFRSIQDGFDDLLEGQGDSVTSMAAHAKTMTDRIANIFVEQGFVSGPLNVTLARRQGHFGHSRTSSVKEPYEALHADYMEVAGYVVTAVLYDEPDEDLEGGETCFADSFISATPTATNDGSTSKHEESGDDITINSSEDAKKEGFTLHEGVIIEPKKGRLVLFSGDGSNVHGPLPIRRKDQSRPIYIFFFHCLESDEASINDEKLDEMPEQAT